MNAAYKHIATTGIIHVRIDMHVYTSIQVYTQNDHASERKQPFCKQHEHP